MPCGLAQVPSGRDSRSELLECLRTAVCDQVQGGILDALARAAVERIEILDVAADLLQDSVDGPAGLVAVEHPWVGEHLDQDAGKPGCLR